MKAVFAMFVFYLASSLVGSIYAGEDDRAYLIIHSSVEDPEQPQPKWFAFKDKTDTYYHRRADKDYVNLSPGVYKLLHIDFTEDIESRENIEWDFFKKVIIQDKQKFRFKAGHIYLLGHYKLVPSKTPTGYKMQFEPGLDLLKNACAKSPEIFKNYPLTDVNNIKSVKINCD